MAIGSLDLFGGRKIASFRLVPGGSERLTLLVVEHNRRHALLIHIQRHSREIVLAGFRPGPDALQRFLEQCRHTSTIAFGPDPAKPCRSVPFQSLSNSLIEVLLRVFSSTRLTITAQ